MNTPQIIRTPGGEELVILPKADYDAMIEALSEAEEDAADVAAYDLAIEAIGDDSTPFLPEAISAFLLGGDGLLKAIRKWRGLSQVDLAERVGVAQGYISDLESGRRQGTPETLVRLADALDIPTAWLVRR